MKAKINIDREPLTPEEIRGRKDFNAVLKQYQQSPAQAGSATKPFFKSTGFLASGVLVVCTAVSVFMYSIYHSKSESKANVEKSVLKPEQNSNLTYLPAATGNLKMKISPPIKKLDIPYQHYQVDAAQGGEFKTQKGSRIRVPKQAFADANGKALNGQVELRFREFHDPVDFFLCGIPMCYDSAGVRYQFESAGMIELLGFKDGKPVYILPGKKVEIELDSRRTGGTAYNIYRFDTATCNWEYLGKDKLARQAVSEATGRASDSVSDQARINALPEIKAIDAQIEQVRTDCEKQLQQLPKNPAEPSKPVKATASRKHFNIDVKASEFPELVQYKSSDWEVDPANKKVSDEIFDMTWEDAKLSEGTKKGVNYYLTLSGNNKTIKLLVDPVFEGKNYDKAMADFNSKFKIYESGRQDRLAKEQKIKMFEDSMVTATVEKRKELLAARNFEMNKTASLVSCFSISGFGVYNCDAPCYYPKGMVTPIRLVDASGNLLPCRDAYLVDNSKNSLFTYYGAEIPAFRFNPQAKNLLWTMANGKLYLLRNKQFSTITGVAGHQDVQMEEVKQEFKTAEEMKVYMGI
ncbi:MAG: hypothetical protein ACHQRM_05255 [Bacteroidia bacterium]